MDGIAAVQLTMNNGEVVSAEEKAQATQTSLKSRKEA